MELSLTLLILSSIVVRVYAAGLRLRTPRALALLGWLVCAGAGWLAAGAAGAWFPLWPVLTLGMLGFVADEYAPNPWTSMVLDGVVVVLAGLLSPPPVSLAVVVGAAALWVAAGLAMDWVMARVPRWVLVAGVAAPLVAAIGIFALRPTQVLERSVTVGERLALPGSLPYLAVTHAYQNGRVVLETGAVGWLAYPRGEGPHPGALVFHGAHEDGSHQPAALVLRRALLDAGYAVLAVDHPGYGESPPPAADTGIAGWDPLPTALAGLEALRATGRVDGVTVLGHSMGATDALRLLSASDDLQGAVLFGSSLVEGEESPELIDYWYGRFLGDRGLSRDYLPQDEVTRIRYEFYREGTYARRLGSDHPPIRFVEFGVEWPNIVAGRRALYDIFPGAKELWSLDGSTHYFNAHGKLGVVAGDTRVTRDLTLRLARLAAENAAPPGAPASTAAGGHAERRTGP